MGAFNDRATTTNGALNPKSRPEGSRKEVLLDQHDHLLIEISVAADAPAPCSDRLDELNKRLIQVENELAKSWSN